MEKAEKLSGSEMPSFGASLVIVVIAYLESNTVSHSREGAQARHDCTCNRNWLLGAIISIVLLVAFLLHSVLSQCHLVKLDWRSQFMFVLAFRSRG